MSSVLQFNSQAWKLWRSEGLNLFLPRSTGPDRVYFCAEWTFVRPEVTDETFTLKQPQFHLSVMGCVPDLHDWRDLAGRNLADNDDSEDDLNLFCGGPDLFAYPPDADPKSRPDGWDTQLFFGERQGHEFEFEMAAFRSSERARKANRELQVKQILGEKLPPDWEGRDWLDEGDRLSFSGRIRLEEILCQVPINTGQPIEWARQLTRKEVKFDEFGFCHVNGGDHFNGTFKPADGISEQGRLVVLNRADDYFYEWQRRQKQPPQA